MQKNMSGTLNGVIDEMLSGSVAGNIQFESSGGGSNVTITPTLESGTKIADFTIDDTTGELYTPTPTEYEAGDNITIENGVISATDTTYTAGDGIKIEDGTISINLNFNYEQMAYFNGSYSINTAITLNDNQKFILEFNQDNNEMNRSIVGTTGGSNLYHLTPFNNKWFTSNGSNEINFGTFSQGYHSFVWNDNGNIVMDNVVVGQCQPINNNSIIQLGTRYGASSYKGYIKRFTIIDTLTDNIIRDYRAFKLMLDNIELSHGLIETVTGEIFNLSVINI